jgi:hypothetical protein
MALNHASSGKLVIGSGYLVLTNRYNHALSAF